MELNKALESLRAEKDRKFDQTLDLIINLKGIDLKRENINLVVNIPHKVKDKRVCGFLTKRNNLVKTITEPEFKKYSDKKELKKLIKEYDFFIAHGSLMPKVATVFGKVLGPAGKMPSPQLGIITQEDDKTVAALLEKVSRSVKIRAKEPSIKLGIGKSTMENDKIIENIKAVYNAIVNTLPAKKDNVKNVEIKFTMSKLAKVEV